MSLLICGGKLLLSGGRLLRATPGSGQSIPDGAATVVTLTDFVLDRQFYQRDALNGYDLPIYGTSDGTTPVQSRVVDAATGAEVVPWTTIASPSDGVFAGNLRTPQYPDPMKLEVRDTGNPAVKAVGIKRFEVGAVGIWWGQSNAVAMPVGYWQLALSSKGSLEFTGGSFNASGAYVGGVYKRIGVYNDAYPPSTRGSAFVSGGHATRSAEDEERRNDGYTYIANVIAAELGCAVLLIDSTAGGQPIIEWAPGKTQWNRLAARVAAAGGDAEFSVLWQGEQDAANNLAGSTYKTRLAERQAQFHALTGRDASTFKFGVVSIGAVAADGGYAVNIGGIRAAQVEFANNTPGAFLAHCAQDCETSDSVHILKRDLSRGGACIGHSVAAQYGGSTKSGAGPRVIGAALVGGVHIDYTVQHTGGTALLDGAGGTGTALAGIRVWLTSDPNKTPLPIVATGITAANKFRVSLSANPGAPVSTDYAMIPAPHAPDLVNSRDQPNYASAIYDNAKLVNQERGGILQPFPAMAVTGS